VPLVAILNEPFHLVFILSFFVGFKNKMRPAKGNCPKTLQYFQITPPYRTMKLAITGLWSDSFGVFIF
jgi:hypothetical protein